MNLNILEKLTRQAIKGNNVVAASSEMLKNGFISPAEHRSVQSLSWQIAANLNATAGGAVAAPPTTVYRVWI
ncbi:MAG: hypothetical protein M3437_20170 [Chloroflexota bacterium]|nr:hypothetical protein [Chloroflexota bacterium]MDQ5866745.1 hypothetical protein [Chloroflexota bacterium]